MWSVKVGEFVVTPLMLKGNGNYAHHCIDCGAPLPRWGGNPKKRNRCKSCNGKRTGSMGKTDAKPHILDSTQNHRRIK